MISGRLDYTDVFGLSYSVINDTNDTDNVEVDEIRNNILYPESARFVWVIVLVFIPILLSNMLVSETFQYLV